MLAGLLPMVQSMRVQRAEATAQQMRSAAQEARVKLQVCIDSAQRSFAETL
jgi:hypothetical protein